MAGLIVIGNDKYIGTLKLKTGETAIENGMFVAPDWANGVAATPTANTVVPYIVLNEIDTVAEELISDLDFTVAAGKYLKIKRLLPGEIFVTTKAVGTPAVGDIVDCGTTGKITATSGSPAQTFEVIEKPTMWGVTVYKCLVLDC